MRLFSGMSLRSIGDTFKQDHATVLHAINTINGLKEFDKDMMHKYETIEKMIVNAIVARMNYDKDELNVKQFTDMLTTLVENLPVKLLQYGVLFNPKLQV
jgi:hypothetical protein